SPDGRYLGFLATPEGADKSQLLVLDRRGGNARPLTNVTGELEDYAWSPDGKRIVFVMEQPEEKVPKPIVIDAWHFKQDREGYLHAARATHLYLIDVESRKTEALTSDPAFSETLPCWSPEGRWIAFVRSKGFAPDEDGRTELDLIEPKVGAKAHSIARIFAPNQQRLAFSPDGAWLAFLQGLEPKFNAYMQDHLYLISPAGGTTRPVAAKLDREITSYAFSADSKSLEISVEDDTRAYLARVDAASDAVQPTAQGDFVASAVSSAHAHTAFLKSDDRTLAELFALEGGKARKLTAHNDAWLDEVQLGSVEEMRFKNRSGGEIHALLIKPPAFTATHKYPLLLWIHGGPNGQDAHSLAIDGYEFEPQMFADRGFLVLRVNYRGSSGRGIEFAKAIFADWGHKEVEDLLSGVDHVVALGFADPQRLAIGGWSYGGLLTDYTIASDRRFKAAISGAGSGNQLSTYGTDEYILQYDNELDVPWHKTSLWLKLSYPFFHADRIHTPTLFVGGEKDFNVPILGSEQMYQALRDLHVATELVIYPGQNHIFTRPSFLKDLAERMPEWIERFIPAEGTKAIDR
ncbi:MAG: S9 family peptidase, partial [Alphaproteobacteria bacterium]|nr:S9 family peptidase [Alphaproteobacteria bacterium]